MLRIPWTDHVINEVLIRRVTIIKVLLTIINQNSCDIKSKSSRKMHNEQKGLEKRILTGHIDSKRSREK